MQFFNRSVGLEPTAETYNMMMCCQAEKGDLDGIREVSSLAIFIPVGWWFPPGTPVSSTRKLVSSSSFYHLDMTLAVAEALNPNKPNHHTCMVVFLEVLRADLF